jgi:hypothetical protein
VYAALGRSLSNINNLRLELDQYVSWLLHRSWPLGQRKGVGAYHEVAVAVYGRAKEIEILIRRQEDDGTLVKGSALPKFRQGELRYFLEMASKCVDRGSREITEAQLVVEGIRGGI